MAAAAAINHNDTTIVDISDTSANLKKNVLEKSTQLAIFQLYILLTIWFISNSQHLKKKKEGRVGNIPLKGHY